MYICVCMFVCAQVTSLLTECTINSNFLYPTSTRWPGGPPKYFRPLKFVIFFPSINEATKPSNVWNKNMNGCYVVNECVLCVHKQGERSNFARVSSFQFQSQLGMNCCLYAGTTLLSKTYGPFKSKKTSPCSIVATSTNAIHKEQILHQERKSFATKIGYSVQKTLLVLWMRLPVKISSQFITMFGNKKKRHN